MAQGGGLPRADIGDARPHDHGAVDFDPDPSFRSIMEPCYPAVALLIGCNASSDFYHTAVGRFVTQRLQRLRHTFVGPDCALDGLAGSSLIARAHEIEAAEFKPVEAKCFRDLVHLSLIGNAGLRSTETPEGTGIHIIGRNCSGVDFDIIDSIWAWCCDGAIKQHIGAKEYVSPRIRADLYFYGGDLAILSDAGLI